MLQSRIAEWSYKLGCVSAAAAIVYRVLWFGGLGVRLFGRLRVVPHNLMELSILLLVISIAGNAQTLVHREDGRSDVKGRLHDLGIMCLLLAMHFRVTCGTERDQVLLGIVSGLASVLFMVDLKVHPCAARLASPAVPLQDLSTELLVRFRIQPQSLDVLVG